MFATSLCSRLQPQPHCGRGTVQNHPTDHPSCIAALVSCVPPNVCAGIACWVRLALALPGSHQRGEPSYACAGVIPSVLEDAWSCQHDGTDFDSAGLTGVKIRMRPDVALATVWLGHQAIKGLAEVSIERRWC